MAENKMKEVAQMFGVEFGEKFNIKNNHYNPYHFEEEKGLIDRDGDVRSPMLNRLILGEVEIEKPILDKTEKRYLEAVLRPFKNRIRYIGKHSMPERGYYINAKLEVEGMSFPYFKEDTMYKGMKLNKKYSLKELGLFENE